MKSLRSIPLFVVATLIAAGCSDSAKSISGTGLSFGGNSATETTQPQVTFAPSDVEGTWSMTVGSLAFDAEYAADGSKLSGDITLPDVMSLDAAGAVSGSSTQSGGHGATVWTGTSTYTGQMANDKQSISGQVGYRRTGTSGVSNSLDSWNAVKTGGPSSGTGGAGSTVETGVGGSESNGGAGGAQGGDSSLSAGTGPGIHIVSATYGPECGVPKGNVTAQTAAMCDGLATCNIYVANSTFGGDPAYRCVKGFEVIWTCGSDPTMLQLNVSQAELDNVLVECPSH